MVSDVLGRNCYNVDMLYIAWRNRRFRDLDPLTNVWNSLPEIVISADTTETFKRRLDKF